MTNKTPLVEIASTPHRLRVNVLDLSPRKKNICLMYRLFQGIGCLHHQESMFPVSMYADFQETQMRGVLA
jgi:hypothetical protein